MSQIATGHNINLKVPARPFYEVSLFNDGNTEEKTCGEIPALKSDMKSYHLAEPSRSELTKITTNHVTFLRTYKVIYLGYAVLDRRYTLPMLPWVIAEIRRHGSQNLEEIYIEVTDKSLKAVNCEYNQLVFEHKLQSISKFAQSSNDASCFTYMTREVVNGPCAYHVFQASDENTVLELFTTIREATKEISSNQIQAPPVMRTSTGITLEAMVTSCQQYEVLYLGRIKVTGKRAPPTFIDDAVEKFRIYEVEKSRNYQNGLSNNRRRHGSGASISSLPQNINIVENVNGNGLDTNSSGNDVSSTDRANLKNLDLFSHIYCDNYTEPFVQSPMNSLYTPDQTHKYHSFTQSSVNHDHLTGLPSLVYHLQNEKRNFNTSNSLMPPSSLITHTQSLDAPGCADIVRDLRDNDPSVTLRDRTRSCSGDIPRTKQTSLPTFRQRLGSGGCNELVRPRSYTNPNPGSNQHQQNRTMLFIIGRLEIWLIRMDKKQTLLSKTFNDIAHCSQGVKHLDHFGFISRETTLTGADCYAGYIFRCQTESVVDEIMSSLREAFRRAHEKIQSCSLRNLSSPKFTVCDECPMNWFHVLCSEIEGLVPNEASPIIFRMIGTLPDANKEEVMIKFQNINVRNMQEQNEVLMILLRETCEQLQLKHDHLSPSTSEGKNEASGEKEKPSKLDSFRQKAKKSLSSSIESFRKLTGRDEGREASSDSLKQLEGAICEEEDPNQKNLDTRSCREGSYSGECSTGEKLSPVLSRPRSSTFSSPREKINISKRTGKDIEETPKTSRPRSTFLKSSGLKSKTPSPALETPKASWRQAIFYRVQSARKGEGSSQDSSEQEPRPRRSGAELRALWKKAIGEQIILIRMEKENNKLRARQDAATLKRMKLIYDEVAPCVRTVISDWERIFTRRVGVRILDKHSVIYLVKSGVPKHRRGEIWEYLMDCNLLWSNTTELQVVPRYEELLGELTPHTHAILTDIGRTFPGHPYFQQHLGPGQLALYNVLKAYSLYDPEVGYCQGMSFIAGILILHANEEHAFELFKYLMFNLGFRNQYTSHMVAFHAHIYQLSRLILDKYPELFYHLEKHEISTTLYAAPWFLTIFASQFSIGFVSRLFDFIFLFGMEVVFKVAILLLGTFRNGLLSCNTFESIVEYLKTSLLNMNNVQIEHLFSQVVTLDISRQLENYDIEYNVYLEEMDRCPSRCAEEIEQLQATNESLKAENADLKEQLQEVRSRIAALEAAEASMKSSIRRLETRAATLEEEKEGLQHCLCILKKRVEKLEVARFGGGDDGKDVEERPPQLGVVYALAGSEKEEDERFKELMKGIKEEGEPFEDPSKDEEIEEFSAEDSAHSE